MKREHVRCLYDCCNFYGRNGGAWADLWGDDLVIFGGMWHGDVTNNRTGKPDNPFTWLPGAGPTERSVDRLCDGNVRIKDVVVAVRLDNIQEPHAWADDADVYVINDKVTTTVGEIRKLLKEMPSCEK